MQTIPIIYHPQMSKFDFGKGHPFRGERFDSFMKLFRKIGLDKNPLFEVVEPDMAEEEDLEIVHTREYIDHVKKLEQHGGHLSIDTYVTPGMVEAAKWVVGAGLMAAKLIMKDRYNQAITFGGFHHAGVRNGEGFCVFNDVAITAKRLLEEYNVKKVLIIDTDAHQGNGTMDIFYDDPRVLFISLHQDPRTLYPGKGFVNETGRGAGKGYTVNLSMPMFAGNGQYEYALNEIFVPLAREFMAEVIIQNGGADPHYADHLTELGLDLNGLKMMGQIIKETADETSNKLIDMIVSGYGDLVPYGWLAIITGVAKLDLDCNRLVTEPEKTVPSWAKGQYEALDFRTKEMVKSVKAELKKYWSCLR